ncbi:MAG: hypothetical protein KDA67_09895 [Rhodobacteraceae bacterium]|nr:hypothetical protein [Paracoccaceae bacterium]
MNEDVPANPSILVQTKSGDYRIFADARLIGPDVLVCIWGGERPHIGAVAAAQPRPSLADPSVTSATASVLTYPGHKEDEVVKFASQELAGALDTNVVVTAGIHWDDLSPDAIAIIRQRCVEITDLLKSALTKRSHR